MNSTLLDDGMKALGATFVHRGKVRDVYMLPDGRLAMIATNRISAFDIVLPEAVPYKGEILNRISWHMLCATRQIVSNWALYMPDPQVTIGIACEPIKVEMVVRNFLTGSWWRKHNDDGLMVIGDYKFDRKMKQFERFQEDGPIVTPTTKADEGHDEDITKAEAIRRGLCTDEEWETMSRYSLDLFREGTRIAFEHGLVFCDTKYEFGRTPDGRIIVIDEVNTPDSSRYYYAKGFDKLVEAGGKPKELSKEFVRQGLITSGLDPKRPAETMPVLTTEWAQGVTDRYIELYEAVTGEKFKPMPVPVTISPEARVVAVVHDYLTGVRVW